MRSVVEEMRERSGAGAVGWTSHGLAWIVLGHPTAEQRVGQTWWRGGHNALLHLWLVELWQVLWWLLWCWTLRRDSCELSLLEEFGVRLRWELARVALLDEFEQEVALLVCGRLWALSSAIGRREERARRAGIDVFLATVEAVVLATWRREVLAASIRLCGSCQRASRAVGGVAGEKLVH
jgi:hypothetical protein